MNPQNETNHSVRLLFDRMLTEFRAIVKDELSQLRTELRRDLEHAQIPLTPRRFYTIKEAAVELEVSPATVRRLIDRGLFRPNKAIRHIRIAREQIDEFASLASVKLAIRERCPGQTLNIIDER